MPFVDEIRIRVKAGDGGNGCCSFRREKYVPRGGPDGGNGGRGGDVLLVADARSSTFAHLINGRRYRAERGEHGRGKQQTGADGQPRRLRVPVGTVVRDAATGAYLADLTQEGETCVVAAGGRGGRGNATFASATNQAPRRVEPGAPGQARDLDLDLKLLADVGLVGLPNAGKSTLIGLLTAAHPEVAPYPFTTKSPQLGVAVLPGWRRCVIADVPGLIDGASEGRGLGLQFLKHLERTRVLVHLVDVSTGAERPAPEALTVITGEMERFSPRLLEKPRVVVASKMDAADPGQVEALVAACAAAGLPLLKVSAHADTGLEALVAHLTGLLAPGPKAAAAGRKGSPA